jgi:ketopantoate reductase
MSEIGVTVVGTGGMGGLRAMCLHRKATGARVTLDSDADVDLFAEGVETSRDYSVRAIEAMPAPYASETIEVIR